MHWYTILHLRSAEYAFFLLGLADMVYGYCSFLKIPPRADCIHNAGIPTQLKFTVVQRVRKHEFEPLHVKRQNALLASVASPPSELNG